MYGARARVGWRAMCGSQPVSLFRPRSAPPGPFRPVLFVRSISSGLFRPGPLCPARFVRSIVPGGRT